MKWVNLLWLNFEAHKYRKNMKNMKNMKTTELLAAVMNADESTRMAIKYVLNLVDDNQNNEQFSLRFVKTELPR